MFKYWDSNLFIITVFSQCFTFLTVISDSGLSVSDFLENLTVTLQLIRYKNSRPLKVILLFPDILLKFVSLFL